MNWRIRGCLLLAATVLQPQPAHAGEPDCFGVSYAAIKVGAYKYEMVAAPEPVQDADSLPSTSDANRIQRQDKPLASIPPELGRIQRGAVQSWLGGYINEGLSGYSGIDLERKISVNVERRIRSSKAAVPLEITAPSFASYDHTTFARKFSSDQVDQMEIVSTRRLDSAQLAAFVCIANEIWKTAPPKPDGAPPMRPTDTLGQSNFLRDRDRENGKWLAFLKSYDAGGPLSIVFGQAAPERYYKWPAR